MDVFWNPSRAERTGLEKSSAPWTQREDTCSQLFCGMRLLPTWKTDETANQSHVRVDSHLFLRVHTACLNQWHVGGWKLVRRAKPPLRLSRQSLFLRLYSDFLWHPKRTIWANVSPRDSNLSSGASIHADIPPPQGFELLNIHTKQKERLAWHDCVQWRTSCLFGYRQINIFHLKASGIGLGCYESAA